MQSSSYESDSNDSSYATDWLKGKTIETASKIKNTGISTTFSPNITVGISS